MSKSGANLLDAAEGLLAQARHEINELRFYLDAAKSEACMLREERDALKRALHYARWHGDVDGEDNN